MENYSSQQIIDGLKNRNNEVLKFVIIQNLPMIVYLVESKNGFRQDAEDILQEALIILITKAERDEFKLTAKFSTFLYAICQNLWLAKYKAKNNESEHLNIYAGDIYNKDSTAMENEEQTNAVFQHYFNQLSKVCKEIIRLYSLNYSVEKISGMMDKTEKSVRKRKYECKNHLITLIKENSDKI